MLFYYKIYEQTVQFESLSAKSQHIKNQVQYVTLLSQNLISFTL